MKEEKETRTEEPIVAWARTSAELCQHQAQPATWNAFEKTQFKRSRSVGACLLDHQNAASACARAAIDRDDRFASKGRFQPSRALQMLCRKALKRLQTRYGAYMENIPEDVGALAYRTRAEHKLDMVLITKAGMLEFPSRQFRWCTKLFGKEQRQCERFYQSYVRTFGTTRYERIIRRYVAHMIAQYRRHLGNEWGM